MADPVRITDLPIPSAKEDVAFQLMRYIYNSGHRVPQGEDIPPHILDLYAQCLRATSGLR